jgi:hypothetical protein
MNFPKIESRAEAETLALEVRLVTHLRAMRRLSVAEANEKAIAKYRKDLKEICPRGK